MAIATTATPRRKKPKAVFYVAVLLVLSKIFDVAFEPLTWWLLSSGAGALALWRGRTRLAIALALGGAVMLVGASLPVVSQTLSRGLEADGVSTMTREPYDVVLLLGGVVEGPTSEIESLRINGNAERLVATFELLRSGHAAKALISGGSFGEMPEARLLAEVLERWGIERSRLLLDETSLNTHQNAVNSAALLQGSGAHRVLVVTSASHAPRAMGCLRKEGVVADLFAVDHRLAPQVRGWWPRAVWLEATTSALREWAGRLLYRWLGYT